MKKARTKCYLYTRVSTAMQVDGYSLDAQRDKLRKYADYEARYYYYCKHTKMQTGHDCTFRLNVEQSEVNQMVASIVSAMVHDPRFVDAIKDKIGSAVDTSELERQMDTIKTQLRQRLSTKSRLEHQLDTLDFNDPYYDRKILNLQRRYDEQYELIEDMESQLSEIQGQIDDIHQEKITGDNIYRLLLAFDEVYNAATEVEQKEFMRAFIERIDLFPERQPDGNWIQNVVFNFPVPYNGKKIREFPLESQSTVVEVLFLSSLLRVLRICNFQAAIQFFKCTFLKGTRAASFFSL